MPYFNGMLYRALPFYKRHALVFRNVWTCAYPRVWAKNVIIKISSTHALAAYVFAFVQRSFREITYPVELGLVILFLGIFIFFGFVLFWFLVFLFLVLLAMAEKSNNELENKKPNNQEPPQKNKTAHPKGGSSGRELGLVIFLFLFFLFCFFGFLFFVFFVFLVFGFV